MYDEISIGEFRVRLRDAVDHTMAGGARLMILRNGKPVAGLVPPDDLLALEKADGGKMAYHEQMMDHKLREIRQLKRAMEAVKEMPVDGYERYNDG